MTRPDDGWMADGECVQTGDIHHPEDGQTYAGIRWVAKVVCGRCKVRPDCLDYALAVETDATRAGIWGGTTPEDRDRLARTGRHRPVKAPRSGADGSGIPAHTPTREQTLSRREAAS